MLFELSCDKFIVSGQRRAPIRFNEGLNTILGDETATNSIGKSTLLLILDFVFGGSDYVEKALDVQEQVGPHEIRFAHKFGTEVYYWMRSTVRPGVVSRCDKEYVSEEELSVEEYCAWMKEKYGIARSESSFRGAVSAFIRVYQRENYDEHNPLKSFPLETFAQSIVRLLQLFGLYKSLVEKKERSDLSKNESDVFGKSIQFGFLEAATTKKDYEKLKAEIKTLQSDIALLTESIAHDGCTKAELEIIQTVRQEIRRQTVVRSRIESSLGQSRLNGRPGGAITPSVMRQMTKFFPKVDLKSLEEVDSFHSKLMGMISEQVDQEKERLAGELKEVEKRIDVLKTELRGFVSDDRMGSAALETYYSKRDRVRKLELVCANFEQREKLRQKKKVAKEDLEAAARSTLDDVQHRINEKMHFYNSQVYSEDRSSPELHLENMSKYRFATPMDTGTGTTCKGMVLFDLSMLALTELPFLVHDSFFLKQIGDSPLEKILELYSGAGKQVFIALDKAASYSERATVILNQTKVIEMSDDEEALFGRSWAVRRK